MTGSRQRPRWSLLVAPFFACLLVLALAACAGGKPRRIFPPTASVQQLEVRADGSWLLSLRLQNFSNVGMRIAAIEARLEIGAVEVGTLRREPGFVVPANSSEILQLELVPRDAAREGVAAVLETRDSIAYSISGTIRSDEPTSRNDAFEFQSALTPVPGLPGTLR